MLFPSLSFSSPRSLLRPPAQPPCLTPHTPLSVGTAVLSVTAGPADKQREAAQTLQIMCDALPPKQHSPLTLHTPPPPTHPHTPSWGAALCLCRGVTSSSSSSSATRANTQHKTLTLGACLSPQHSLCSALTLLLDPHKQHTGSQCKCNVTAIGMTTTVGAETCAKSEGPAPRQTGKALRAVMCMCASHLATLVHRGRTQEVTLCRSRWWTPAAAARMKAPGAAKTCTKLLTALQSAATKSSSSVALQPKHNNHSHGPCLTHSQQLL